MEGVQGTERKGGLGHGDHPPLRGLGQDSHRPRGQREDQERRFTPKCFLREGKEFSQGPVVQQDQNQGKGNSHGFGQESQEKKPQAGAHPSSLSPGPRGVGQINHKACQEKEAAEDVLSFGNPSHRFHMDRVEPE